MSERPWFYFLLNRNLNEILMCSFVVNKISDSVALDTKLFPWLQLITDHWWLFMLFLCWMFGLGTTFLPALLCSDLYQGCLFLFEIHQQLRELASSLSTKPSTFVYRTAHFCLLIPTSQHLLCSWAITDSTATVGYFWDISIPNSNEISHHIKNMPYASFNVPSTSGTHFLVICLSLMAAHSHAAGR